VKIPFLNAGATQPATTAHGAIQITGFCIQPQQVCIPYDAQTVFFFCILATAPGDADTVARSYHDWLQGLGISAEILPVSLSNIERASRDRSLLKQIGQMGRLLFTGGDQRRLTEALLHCAEATPVLHEVVSAYERGVPLIAVAAAASALAERMIVEGDSEAALR
jgi:cyanophycinase-like exopeptidase